MRSHYLRSSMMAAPQPPPKPRRSFRKLFLTAVVILALAAGASAWDSNQSDSNNQQPAAVTVANDKPTQARADFKPCEGNHLSKLIHVSISQRRLWLCEGSDSVYQAPIISGMTRQSDTETPLGTYRIYGKMQNTTLSGKDSTGSWRRGVYFWMPFLDNKHGTYGFHDATWRPKNEFGAIDPSSNRGSHGCIELAYGVQERLYQWAPVGTTVKVAS